MATYGWDDIDLFLFGGYDLLDYLAEEIATPEQKAILDTIRAAGNRFPSVKDTGQREAMRPLAFTTLYNDETAGPDAALVSLPTDTEFIVGIEGNVGGRRAVMGTVQSATYERVLGVDKLHRIKAECPIDGVSGFGPILHEQTQETGDFDTEASAYDSGTVGSAATVVSSSVANPSVITTSAAHGFQTGDTVLIAGHTGSTPDINAAHTVTVTGDTTFTIPINVTVGGTGGTATRTSTRNGGVAYFFVPDTTDHPFDLDGGTALDLDARDSPDNATFAELASPTPFTGRGSASVAVSGNVDRYLASGGDFTGTPGSPTASPVISFHRNTE